MCCWYYVALMEISSRELQDNACCVSSILPLASAYYLSLFKTFSCSGCFSAMFHHFVYVLMSIGAQHYGRSL
jgi:hypothetical protein